MKVTVYTLEGKEDVVVGTITYDDDDGLILSDPDDPILNTVVTNPIRDAKRTLYPSDGKEFLSALYRQYRGAYLRVSKPDNYDAAFAFDPKKHPRKGKGREGGRFVRKSQRDSSELMPPMAKSKGKLYAGRVRQKGKVVWVYIKADNHREGYAIAQKLFGESLRAFEPSPIKRKKEGVKVYDGTEVEDEGESGTSSEPMRPMGPPMSKSEGGGPPNSMQFLISRVPDEVRNHPQWEWYADMLIGAEAQFPTVQAIVHNFQQIFGGAQEGGIEQLNTLLANVPEEVQNHPEWNSFVEAVYDNLESGLYDLDMYPNVDAVLDEFHLYLEGLE